MHLDALFQLRRGQSSRTLEGVAAALTALAPAPAPCVVQVVGTNGKGTTAMCLAEICRAAGARVGLFTSPHLHHFRERFALLLPEEDRIQHPSDQQLDAGLAAVAPLIDAHHLAFFDVATLLAARLFADAQVDVAIYEAGIGGRLDATTALPADLTILTSVGRDHQQYLGDTLAQIAADKAAAFRPKKAAISGVTQPELSPLIDALAAAQSTRLWRLSREITCEVEGDAYHLHIPLADLHLRDVALPLCGDFQRRNAALAVAAACQVMADSQWLQLADQSDPEETKRQRDRAIRLGLSRVRWPGRLQPIAVDGRQLWLDGAHNEDAALALARNLPPTAFRLVYGAAQDKDIAGCLRPLLERCTGLYLCPFAQPRAASETQLRAALALATSPQTTQPNGWKAQHFQDVPGALQAAIDDARGDEFILVTGSLFVVAEALAWHQTRSATIP